MIDLEGDALVVGLGSNDLDSRTMPDPIQLAEDIYQFLLQLKQAAKVKAVVIMQAFPRLNPRRHDYNDVLPLYNRHLKNLCRSNQNKIFFFSYRNIIRDWQSMLSRDGTHFNKQGLQRYFRNIREAVIMPAKHTN